MFQDPNSYEHVCKKLLIYLDPDLYWQNSNKQQCCW